MSQGENQEREVRFDLYCKTCEHKDEPVKWNETCDLCLSEPFNYDTDRPVNYVKKEKGK